MARIRSVHPGQWTDDEFVECSPLARLLVIGLRNESDDNGIFEWNPVKLKMRILPADNCNVSGLLTEASSKNQIHPFTVSGKQYGIVRNFVKYQKPKYPTFTYPVPEHLPEGYELHKAYSGKAPGKSDQRRVEESSEEQSASAPKVLSFWDVGESFGISRAVLGRMVRDFGEKQTSDAIQSLSLTNKPIADATQYLFGILRKTKSERPGLGAI